MDLHTKGPDPAPDWTIGEAEALLRSLRGVLSSRVVARPGGEIDEIHLLTTYEVTPKQTVRNVESALRAHFDLRVDHRKISVAQTTQPGKYGLEEKRELEEPVVAEPAADQPTPSATPAPVSPKPSPKPPVVAPPVHRTAPPRGGGASRPALHLGGSRTAAQAVSQPPGPASISVAELRAATAHASVGGPVGGSAHHPPTEPSPDEDEAGLRTIRFLGHQIEAERAQRVKITVAVGWRNGRYEGSAVTADVTRSRQTAFASATLDAVQNVIRAAREGGLRVGGELSLDGIREVEALGRKFVLVSVHAVDGPGVQTLAGTEVVEDSVERAVILATLQATDRWVRGPS